jgi:DNA repair protein RecO (recombination protein O)
MALVKSTAIVLRTHMLGETSKVVVCYTRDHGKVRLVAKGARKGGGKFGAALEPFTVSGVVFYLRPGRGLSLLSQAEIVRDFPAIRRDVVRQSYAGAVVELLDLLVADQSPDPALFDLAERTLGVVADVSPEGLDPVLWRFELRLASALGYAPELSACVSCGRPADDAAWFSPIQGGVVCRRCGAGGGRGSVGGKALDVLRRLARTEEEVTDLADVDRDEIAEALTGFLATHSERPIRLKSMQFLAQVRRLEGSRGEPGREDEQAT